MTSQYSYLRKPSIFCTDSIGLVTAAAALAAAAPAVVRALTR